MKRLFSIALLFLAASIAQAQQEMRPVLEDVYGRWRQAMVTRNAAGWLETTSSRSQVEVRNRIFSEKLPFPAALFNLPAALPQLANLTMAQLKVKGPTAKAVYFGEVDFGVGGKPTENLLVLSFANEGTWKYDNAEFISLVALPDVRAALAKGDYSVVAKPEFEPSGILTPPAPIRLAGPVKYIAKVYAFCPNREVTVQVNRRSRHTFGNTQSAEIVVGGAQDGENLVEFKITNLPGAQGTEPVAIRVYLMSQVAGVKIPAVFDYTVNEGGTVQAKGQGSFTIDGALSARILGR